MIENYPIFHKTVKIFEKLASVTYGREISIDFRIGDLSRIYQANSDRFIVTLGTKAYKRLKRNKQKFLYRSLTHELSHVLFQSFKLNPIIKRIARELELRYDFVHSIANYFEDYRVDYLYHQLYSGAAKITHERNRWIRPKIARKVQFNIFDMLVAILSNNDDLIFQSDDPYLIGLARKTKVLFKEVEGKDYRATAVATLKFLKMLTVNNQTTLSSNTINDLISEVKNSLNPDKMLSLYTQHKKHTDDSLYPKDELDTSCNQIDNQELQELMNSDINQILQESEEQMSKMLQSLKLQLNTLNTENENKLIVKGYEVDISTTIPSVMLSSFQLYDSMPSLVFKLTNLFRRVKNKSKLLNDQFGLMLSIEDVIQSKFNPNIREVFLQEQDTHTELSIKILLDLSESMKYGERISLAATACLTLYDTLDKLPMVDFDVIGFAASGLIVYLPQLDRYNLARIIPCGCTPTHIAVKYARESFSQKSGKRLIIIVTDGEPYFVGYPDDFIWTKQEIDLTRKSGIEVFTYFIAPSENRVKEQQMKIFGAPTTYEIVTDVNQLPQKLINFVSAKIVKTLLK